MNAPGPGLQPERTALAWQRTGLSAAVVAVLLLRTGILRGSPLDVVAAGCAVTVGVLTWLIGGRSRERGTSRPVLFVVAAGVCVTGLLVVAQSVWTFVAAR